MHYKSSLTSYITTILPDSAANPRTKHGKQFSLTRFSLTAAKLFPSILDQVVTQKTAVLFSTDQTKAGLLWDGRQTPDSLPHHQCTKLC